RRRLRVVGRDDEVPVIGEDPRVDELVLWVVLAARRVLLAQLLIRELGLRVVVAPAQPRTGRRRVLVPPVVLGVLAVVALGVGQAEGTFLEDRVASVPEGQREAPVLVEVAQPGQAVLAPPVGARARVLE